jgi:hypothetical protein
MFHLELSRMDLKSKIQASKFSEGPRIITTNVRKSSQYKTGPNNC